MGNKAVLDNPTQSCDSELELESAPENILDSESVSDELEEDVEDSEVEVMEVRTSAPLELPTLMDSNPELVEKKDEVIAVPVDDAIDFRITENVESVLESTPESRCPDEEPLNEDPPVMEV